MAYDYAYRHRDTHKARWPAGWKALDNVKGLPLVQAVPNVFADRA